MYAILLEWPLTSELTLGAPISTSGTQVTMLGYEGEFNWKPATDKGGIIVTFPSIPVSKLPCQWAWALKLENVKWPSKVASIQKLPQPCFWKRRLTLEFMRDLACCH